MTYFKHLGRIEIIGEEDAGEEEGGGGAEAKEDETKGERDGRRRMKDLIDGKLGRHTSDRIESSSLSTDDESMLVGKRSHTSQTPGAIVR